MKKQGISRDELPWKGPGQPYVAWIGLVSFSIILLTAGYAVFINGDWDTETFVSAYFNIPLIFVLYFGYKFAKKTKIVSLEEMPIRPFLDLVRFSCISVSLRRLFAHQSGLRLAITRSLLSSRSEDGRG